MSAESPDPDVTARLLRNRLQSGALEIQVAGTSMRGVIDSGAMVEVHAASQPRVGEIWAFTDDDGSLVVHRVRHIHPDGIVGRGTGNATDDDPVAPDRLVGRVHHATTPSGRDHYGEFDRRRAALEFRARRAIRSLGISPRRRTR